MTTLDTPTTVEVIEAGPLRVEIEVRGHHRLVNQATNDAWKIELRGRVIAYAGKPYIHVEHQFVHVGDAAEVTLDEYTSLLIFAAEAAPLGLLDWYTYPDYPASRAPLFQ